jgi:DNA-binding Lrp family transcriptional regulator
MTVAQVLIKAELGWAESIAAELSRNAEVRFCGIVTGPYDVVAIVTVPGNRELGEFVVRKAQTTPGVRHAWTQVVTATFEDGKPRGRATYP